MREQIRDKERLQHILDAIDVLQDGVRRFDFNEIKDDHIIFYGFVKQIEIIGEATYMLSKGFKEAHTDVNWAPIENMRHVLVHGYFAINPNMLLCVIEDDLPVLKPLIEAYLKEQTR